MQIKISDEQLRTAAAGGAEAFVDAVKDAIANAVGGELNAEALQQLSADQVTLWAYFILRDEVMDGGFLQLIYNGYGPLFFRNPFPRALDGWGLEDAGKLMRRAHRLYDKYYREIEPEVDDDTFMALFEKYPQFDELDDRFVENEEEWTLAVAHYVDEHLDSFVSVE